jgi:DNA-binding PadR family transcriptional regulator
MYDSIYQAGPNRPSGRFGGSREETAMSLRYALLGLLAEQPMSGYDLAKKFDRSLTHVWSARHSQIYPELARLRDEGLILQVEAGPRGRKAYGITDTGLAEVRRWMTETEPDRSARQEAFLRVFFLWLLPQAEAAAYLRRQAEYHRALLGQYREYAAAPPPSTDRERSFRIALEAGIRQEQALLSWAEWAAAEVESRRPRRPRRPRRRSA